MSPSPPNNPGHSSSPLRSTDSSQSIQPRAQAAFSHSTGSIQPPEVEASVAASTSKGTLTQLSSEQVVEAASKQIAQVQRTSQADQQVVHAFGGHNIQFQNIPQNRHQHPASGIAAESELRISTTTPSIEDSVRQASGTSTSPLSDSPVGARNRQIERSPRPQKKARAECATMNRAGESLAFDAGLAEYGKIVCQKMIGNINKGGVSIATANQGSINQIFFEPLETPFSWRIREGVKASEALKAFFRGPSAIECGTYLVACQLDGLREYLGDGLFNQHFGDGTENVPLTGRLEIRTDLYDIEFLKNKTNLDVLDKQEGILLGQKVYCSNTQRYNFRHPNGSAQGENLVYLGNNTFFGLGLGNQALTLDQVKETMFRLYASPRKDQEVEIINELLKNPTLTPQQVEHFKSEAKVQVSKEEILEEMEISLGLMLVPSRFLSC